MIDSRGGGRLSYPKLSIFPLFFTAVLNPPYSAKDRSIIGP